MRKIIPLIAIVLTVILMTAACGDSDDVETVNINDVVKVKTDDAGAKYATFKAPEEQASDLEVLNEWYVDYFKPSRDDGTIAYMVVPYSDKKGRCTFFTGVNVYAGCKMKDGIGVIKTAKKHYMTGSHDGLLSEVE